GHAGLAAWPPVSARRPVRRSCDGRRPAADRGHRRRSLARRKHGAGRSGVRRAKMASGRDSGRPVVVVTGMGVVTSLGVGKADNWKKLTAGESGIKTITRFPTGGLKTTMAGAVDFVPTEPFCSTELGERLGIMAIEEAIAQAGIGGGSFP